MKTSIKSLSISKSNQSKEQSGLKLNPLQSLRPQKSMVRIKSLKPKRLNIASKVSINK